MMGNKTDVACELRDSVDSIRNSKNLLSAVDVISEGIITVSRCGVITYFNKAAGRLIGRNDLQGKLFDDVFSFFGTETGETPVGISKKAALSGKTVSCHCSYYEGIGSKKHIALTASPVHHDTKQIQGVVVTLRDETPEKQREQALLCHSYYDRLTGLYNRACFEKKMNQLDTPENYPISMIIGDANGLKFVNDVFGHHHGDRILISIANIMSISCRERDVIARWGGDEFTILMPRTSEEEASKVYENILQLTEKCDSAAAKVSLSMGYATKVDSSVKIDEVLQLAEDYMYRHKLLECRSYRSSVISSLRETLHEKSYETQEHAKRLTSICTRVGRKISLSKKDLCDLELLSMLHDIGKIAISDTILQKPGPLTNDEWRQMKKHSEIGCRIAQSAPELASIAEYILCHHERWDGKGYPRGCKGKRIPVLCRILSVADAYDAMVNDRCYRSALSKEEAVRELETNAGTQFDPEVVSQFTSILCEDEAKRMH